MSQTFRVRAGDPWRGERRLFSHLWLAFIILSISTSIATSCSNAKFEGVQTTSPRDKDKNSGGPDGSGSAGSDGPDSGKGVKDRDEDPLSAGIDSEDGDLCSSNGEVNVVLVFDNSGSQSRSDLASMRSGATAMVNSLSRLADDGKFDVHVATVRFSSSAIAGAYRWVQLGKGDDPDILNDINQATADDGSGTHYAPALNQANSLFAERGVRADEPAKRNFVVFLSDGRPDDDELVMGASQSVADQYSAALITIGTGGNSFNQLRAMASIVGRDFPKGHQGQFFQAESQYQVGQVFEQVANLIDGLCD